MEELLKSVQLRQGGQEEVDVPATPTAPANPDEAEDDEEKLKDQPIWARIGKDKFDEKFVDGLKQSAEAGGKFDMRGGVLGNKWYKHLEESPELKAAYQAIGRGRGAQQEFRKKWGR